MLRLGFLQTKHLTMALAVTLTLSVSLLMLGMPSYGEPLTDKQDLPLFKADYQADIKGFRVKASRELLKQNTDQYLLQFKASSLIASLEENTTLNWKDNRIAPLSYIYSSSVVGKKEERRVDFDHQQKRIESYYKGITKAIPYSDQLLDSLSYQLQLQQDLRASKTDLSYFLVSRSDTKLYDFKREKEEVLRTKLGDLRTVKVTLARDSDKRQTHIWFALDWEYLLVRFEQIEKGKKEFVINLTSATIDNKRIRGLTN